MYYRIEQNSSRQTDRQTDRQILSSNTTKKSIEEIIVKILNDFSKDRKVFSNEAQFQFDLAWSLQKNSEISDKYDIQLEVLAESNGTQKNEAKRKRYIDIVLIAKDRSECIPIEVKYKTSQKEISYYHGRNFLGRTFSQGAPDVGSYFFWKDIERIEQLKHGYMELSNWKGIPIIHGLSVVLTNCLSYTKNNTGLYRDFFPYNERIVDNTTLNANVFTRMENNTEKRCRKTDDNAKMRIVTEDNISDFVVAGYNNTLLYPIRIYGRYSCNWHDYKLNDCVSRFGKQTCLLKNSIEENDNSFFFLVLYDTNDFNQKGRC